MLVVWALPFWEFFKTKILTFTILANYSHWYYKPSSLNSLWVSNCNLNLADLLIGWFLHLPSFPPVSSLGIHDSLFFWSFCFYLTICSILGWVSVFFLLCYCYLQTWLFVKCFLVLEDTTLCINYNLDNSPAPHWLYDCIQEKGFLAMLQIGAFCCGKYNITNSQQDDHYSCIWYYFGNNCQHHSNKSKYSSG